MNKILIVEDEAIMRESLRDSLVEDGYQVETAKDGEEALESIKQKDYGIVILDLRLPGKDGIQVFKEAKSQKPLLKGILITAYPSIQTAVEAIKVGAVEYLPKPFDLNVMEKLIRDTLGPVQMEIRPAVKENVQSAIVEEVKKETILNIPLEQIPQHFELGKTHFAAGRLSEALKEFQDVLAIVPGSIDTRVWLRRTIDAMTKPRVVADGALAIEETRQKECLWMRMGMVAHRICTNNFNCVNCEFDQVMQEKMAAGDSPELEAAVEKFKGLPGNQRTCRYGLKGDVAYRLCTRLFHCSTCEFGQNMEDALQQKITRLAARREALRKKEEQAQAKA